MARKRKPIEDSEIKSFLEAIILDLEEFYKDKDIGSLERADDLLRELLESVRERGLKNEKKSE